MSKHSSTWKQGALRNEICFAIVMLFTAPIIPDKARTTKSPWCYRSQTYKPVFQLFRNAHLSEQQGHSCELAVLKTWFAIVKNSSGFKFTHKDYIWHSSPETVLKTQVYSTTLFQSEVNKQVLIYLYLSLVWADQHICWKLYGIKQNTSFKTKNYSYRH